MTAKILLSDIERVYGSVDEYTKHVAFHVENMAVWHEHHQDYAADPGDHFKEGRKGAYPHPNPHEIVANSVRRISGTNTFVADYEVTDDVSEARLAQKKEALTSSVTSAEAAEVQKLFPSGKQRIWALQYADIQKKPETERTPEEVAFVKDQDSRRDAINKINRHVAQMLSDIEDLTSENVDSWKPSPLKE